MANLRNKKIAGCGGQAATELAIFGAILIFLIGTIVRVVAGNSYSQGHNFEAMRMAMLASWQEAKSGVGKDRQTTSHNSASVLFIQDRLSPDAGKYGDLERNPYIAQGSGTFSYNLLYPLSNAADIKASLPVLDMHINGQHFPFSMSSYVKDKAIKAPLLSECQAFPAGSCRANQCYRNLREWAGGIIKVSSLETPTIAPITTAGTTAAERKTQLKSNACKVFSGLMQAQVISSNLASPGACTSTTTGLFANGLGPLKESGQWQAFEDIYGAMFPANTAAQNKKYLNAILKIVQKAQYKYKLFYSMVANPGAEGQKSRFSRKAPVCTNHPCKNKELSDDVPLKGYTGNLTTDGLGSSTNSNAVMQYDLARNADYSSTTGVLSKFPVAGCPNCMRDHVAWQWFATAGTTPGMIGLNRENGQYPAYDIDGRLKEVTIYRIRQDGRGVTHVDYQDPAGGDIDGSWDINSCGPKPGLQTNSQVYTFTKEGTYLQIKEGKLYNPESGEFVRSALKRNTVDLIQRTIQLSNNTGRFCSNDPAISPPERCEGSGCANPNPVEVCVDGKVASSNCFTSENIAQTCYDTTANIIFVRSRLEDKRGRFWMTNASGQLKLQ